VADQYRSWRFGGHRHRHDQPDSKT
jgi:hypothetical protein